jgi:hypothetical protein
MSAEAQTDQEGAAALESEEQVEDYGYGDDDDDDDAAVVADYGYGDDDDNENGEGGEEYEYRDGDETSFVEEEEEMDEDHSDNVDDDDGNHDNGDADAQNDPLRGLARRENRLVSRFRISLLTFLALAATAMSTITYTACRRRQRAAFVTSFITTRKQILSSWDRSMTVRLQALHGLALDFESYAKYSSNNSNSSDNNTPKNANATCNWPYVTLPDLQQRAAVTQSVAHASSVFILPIVADNDTDANADDDAAAATRRRHEWESYAVQHAPDWLLSSTSTTTTTQKATAFTIAAASSSSSSPAVLTSRAAMAQTTPLSTMIPEHMFDFINGDYDTNPVHVSGPFAPLWQTAPRTNGLHAWINFNLLAWDRVSLGLRHVMQTKKRVAVLERVLNFPPTTDAAGDGENVENNVIGKNGVEPHTASSSSSSTVDALLNALLGHDDSDANKSDAESGDYFKEPASPLFYPIVQASSSSDDDDVDGKDDKVVAVVTAMIYWRTFLEQVLHPSTAAPGSSVTVVIQNSCKDNNDKAAASSSPSSQAFTYEISDNEQPQNGGVTYLGWGDLHDAKFDKMIAQTTSSTKSSSSMSSPSSSSAGTLPLDDDYCPFTMAVYPTTSMMNQHVTTKEPLLYSSLMLGVFLLAALVFLTYDDLVERRQKIVYNHAMRATAVVSSLFPEAVRDRLFAGEDPHGDAAVANAAAEVGTSTTIGSTAGGGATAAAAAAATEQDLEAAAAASSDASTDSSNDGGGCGSCDLETPLLRASASASTLSNYSNTQTLAEPTKMRLKNFLHGSAPAMAGGKSSGVNKPIADLVRVFHLFLNLSEVTM